MPKIVKCHLKLRWSRIWGWGSSCDETPPHQSIKYSVALQWDSSAQIDMCVHHIQVLRKLCGNTQILGFALALKEIVWHFGKHAYLVSCWELDELSWEVSIFSNSLQESQYMPFPICQAIPFKKNILVFAPWFRTWCWNWPKLHKERVTTAPRLLPIRSQSCPPWCECGCFGGSLAAHPRTSSPGCPSLGRRRAWRSRSQRWWRRRRRCPSPRTERRWSRCPEIASHSRAGPAWPPTDTPAKTSRSMTPPLSPPGCSGCRRAVIAQQLTVLRLCAQRIRLLVLVEVSEVLQLNDLVVLVPSLSSGCS